MPYLITACIVFIIYGVAFNLAIKLGLLKPKENQPFTWFLLALCAASWPLTLLVLLLTVLVWAGSKFTNGIAGAILKRIKGNKDAS
ncbi:hypothetical protein nACB1_067 [Acinetobacter phage nACB1]|nr:hypothetical protein nACB1_067 [Acinetobacter phage nACB1]